MENEKYEFEAIDRFLADNPDLEKLSARLSEFNVFQALKIEQREIRHSNVIAWLLDPDESHGFSDIVLRRVLSNILLLSDKTIPNISAAKVELLDFSDIEVLREWKNIDVLVIDRTNKIILFFENKILSGESKGQLAKYKQSIENEFSGFTIIPVFLTLTGHESTEGNAGDYICYSHLQLLSVLEKLYLLRKSQLADPVQIFIQHYLDILRRLTMQDEELMNLCKTIYRKHRKAIDLIVEYAKTSAFQEVMEEILKGEGHEILYSGSSQAWFMPKSWANLIPENGLMWTSLKRPVSVCCFLYQESGKQIRICFEVSKMDNPKLRLKLVKALYEKGFKLTKKAFDENATYSRFYSKNIKVDDTSNDEKLRTAVENFEVLNG